jgi:uncharacterized alpha-E superfamily protein
MVPGEVVIPLFTDLIRALVAAQVATFEVWDADNPQSLRLALNALDECLKDVTKHATSSETFVIPLVTDLIRALVAAQVATFEVWEADNPPNLKLALDALDECLEIATKHAKQLRSES